MEGVGRVIHEPGSLAVELHIEFAGERCASRRSRLRIFPFRKLFKRFRSKAFEKLRVNRFYLRNHFADDGASFTWRVGSGAHTPEAVQNDAGERVNHRRESGDRK